MKKFDYHQPKSLKEAISLMEKLKGRARYIAGGTDILVRIKQGNQGPDALISLRGIEALKGISNEGGVVLKSMTPFRQIERDPLIASNYPALTQAVSVLANPQIRNVATVGGNLCNSAPSADAAPPLLVMEATLIIEGPDGRRELPIDEFFTGPGTNAMNGLEVLREIRLPRPREVTGMAFLKIGRVAQDLAISNVAALLVMDKKVCRKCRLAVGAVAPVPLRLKRVEKILEGEEIGTEILESVGKMVEEEVNPISDVRSTRDYRRQVSGILVKRALRHALANPI